MLVNDYGHGKNPPGPGPYKVVQHMSKRNGSEDERVVGRYEALVAGPLTSDERLDWLAADLTNERSGGDVAKGPTTNPSRPHIPAGHPLASHWDQAERICEL